MSIATEIAGDISVAGTALGGLVLIFMGAAATAFESFPAEFKRAVQPRFRRRAWLTLSAFSFALGSTVLSLLGKWFDSKCLVIFAALCLAMAIVLVSLTALFTVLEIK